MRKKKFSKPSVPRVRRSKEPLSWQFFAATIVLGVFLAAGFFAAARQHFSTMEFSIANSDLRDQIEDMRSETRRLTLQKEVALSPYQIKQAARKLGLTGTTVRNLAPAGEDPGPMLASVTDREEAPVVNEKRQAPIKTFINVGTDSAPVRPAVEKRSPRPKVLKTVNSAPVRVASKKEEKETDLTKSTRSRIIDETARR